jgi:hypothetical protein
MRHDAAIKRAQALPEATPEKRVSCGVCMEHNIHNGCHEGAVSKLGTERSHVGAVSGSTGTYRERLVGSKREREISRSSEG